MKKTLLLAAALACSGMAQAEIYFCETEKRIGIFPFDSAKEQSKLNYIISTSKGFKETDREDYYGTCKTYTTDEDFKNLICIDADGYNLDTITLDLVHMNFTRVEDQQGTAFVAIGSCTELEL